MKFFVPKTTRLFNRKIAVNYIKNLKDNEQNKLDGLAFFLENLILLDNDLNKHEKELTYLHELVHFILFLLKDNLTYNEGLVNRISSCIHQYLRTSFYIDDSFIPSSFSIFGLLCKVIRVPKLLIKEDDDEIHNGTRELVILNKKSNIIKVANYGLVDSVNFVYKEFKISDDAINVAFFFKLFKIILIELCEQKKLAQDDNFLYLFASLFYQSLTESKRS